MDNLSSHEKLYQEFDISSELIRIANKCYALGWPDRAVALAAVTVTKFQIILDGEDSVFEALVKLRTEMGPAAFDQATRPFDYVNSLRILAGTAHEPTPDEVLQPLVESIVIACAVQGFGRGIMQYCLTRLIEREAAAGLNDFVAYYRCLLAYLRYEPWEELAVTLSERFQVEWCNFLQAIQDNEC